ncbi:hypothetical protein IHE45_08G005300 [Dioscorea alata]|uniref:Uncharacterized protein n=1 Tax=Dioscorea alata TaxID=55571 RepID=A0ACB7VH05_DIOAL|nr:hypothetical protein IHE45_08G005300 [Dioscorea alata]
MYTCRNNLNLYIYLLLYLSSVSLFLTLGDNEKWEKLVENSRACMGNTLETERNNASLMLLYVLSCIQKACLFNYVCVYIYI